VEDTTETDEVRHGMTERFSRVPIFSKYLSPDEVATIMAITDKIELKEGAQVFQPGEANDGFYIILSGRIDIRLPDENTPDGFVKIATLGNRSCFGEMSFLRGSARSAWAVADAPSKLTKIRGPEFQALLDEGNLAAYKVVNNFAQLIAMRLRRVESELLRVLDGMAPAKKETKLAELQEFRQKLFQEWSF
jgi:CRP-like cAMP-binding protein